MAAAAAAAGDGGESSSSVQATSEEGKLTRVDTDASAVHILLGTDLEETDETPVVSGRLAAVAQCC